jgi:hypothetical protein
MVDGGFNLDSGSNASQINNVGLDFIDQVNVKTSNFSASTGAIPAPRSTSSPRAAPIAMRQRLRPDS